MKDQIIHSKLDQLQFQTDLNSGKFLIVKITKTGYGAGLYQRTTGMKLAYMFERTVVYDYSDILYPDLYKKTSAVDIADLSPIDKKVFNYCLDQNDKVVYFDFSSYWKNKKLRKYVDNWLPQFLIDKGEKSDYFYGQLLLRWELLPEYQNYIDEAKRRLNFSHPIIGLHIRRGDKNVESPYVPLRIYNYFLKKVVKDTGIKKVFVTSDSSDIFDELPKHLGVDYIYDHEENRYNNANWQLVSDNPSLKIPEAITAAKIINLLSEADYLIGQENVSFTTLAAKFKEGQGYHDRTYFVNRQIGEVSLNNDPSPLFFVIDVFKKFGHLYLQKIVRIFYPLLKDSQIYKKIKSFYYGRRVE